MAYDPLDPFEAVAYDTQAQALRQQYGTALSKNAYNQGNLGLRRQMDNAELGQQFFDFRQKIPGAFAARGFMNSGLYKKSLMDYQNNRLKAQNKLDFNYNEALGGLNLDKLGIEGNLSGGLASIEAQKQVRRATLAAQLKDIA
jgi:hypothetical protein